MTPLRSGLRLRDGRLTLVAPITDTIWRAVEGAPASAGPLQALRTRDVVLKFLPAEAGSTAVLEREAEVTAKASHAGLLKVFGRYVEAGWAILCMERCAFSLGDAVAQGGPLAPEDALAVVREASEAMAAAHRAGIVHGAIKPRNILIREDGSVAVGDFGSARALLDPNARVSAAALLGAIPYLAPEARADPAAGSPASDVYALGVTLATLALGEPPADPFMPEPAARLRALLPDVLAEVVIGACAWSPAARPGDAAAMRLLLERARAAIGSMATLPRGRARWTTPDIPRSAPRPLLRTIEGDAPADTIFPRVPPRMHDPRADRPHAAGVIPLRRRTERIDEAAPGPGVREPGLDGLPMVRQPGEPAPLVELPGSIGSEDGEPPRRAVLAYRNRTEEEEELADANSASEDPRKSPHAPPEGPTLARRPGDWSLFALAGIAAIAAVVSAVGVVVGPAVPAPSPVAADPLATPGPSALAGGNTELPRCEGAPRAFKGVSAPGPRETVAVTTQDLDADGTPDAIFTNQLDESLTVWWGRTDRSAGDRLDLPAGRSHVSPLAHDLDDDGVRDLLVPLPDDSAFVRLRGLGGRMFAASERIPQSPSPRETWSVDAREGPTVLFLAGTSVWARPVVQGQLGEARAVHDLGMTAPAALAVTGADLWLALLGPEPRLLRLDTDLVVREQRRPAGWPQLVTVFAADLDSVRGQELYGVTPSGQAVRLPVGATEAPCAASPDGALQRASVLAHIDADGVPDAVQADSCSQCTSHHAVTFGQSAPP